jgi:hypothetical protein
MDAISPVLNRMPNAFSTATMICMFASESHPSTSGAVVAFVRTSPSSPRTSATILATR